MKRVFLVLSLWLFVSQIGAAEQLGLSVSERYSYAMGARLGQLLKGQGVRDLDSKAFAAAIDDVLGNKPLRLTDAEMAEAIQAQQQQFAKQRETLAEDNLKAGQAYLTANAGKADIVVLPSGLQYRVLEKGEGAQPQPTDTVRVHYHGTLIDGTVFDSSVDRGEPAEFPLPGVIPGFREALSLMHVGDRWQVFVPSALAYGEQGAGVDIGPNETLIFELNLLDIVK